MNNAHFTEQLTMQGTFIPASGISEAVRKNACCFWESQDKALNAMQAFADSWFEGRHAGTRAALEAAERICKAKTPVDLFREYQQWASGALQRLTSDAFACQQHFIVVAHALGQPLTPAAGQSASEPPQAVARTADPSKAA